MVIANINLSFDESGNVKENYEIRGFVKKAKLNILNQFKLENFNFNFNVQKSIYSLKQLDVKLNNIKVTSPLVEIKKKIIYFLLMQNF